MYKYSCFENEFKGDERKCNHVLKFCSSKLPKVLHRVVIEVAIIHDEETHAVALKMLLKPFRSEKVTVWFNRYFEATIRNSRLNIVM